MNALELRSVFKKIEKLRIGVIGDFAVDFYHEIQKDTGETSLETRKGVWWGAKPRTSLGAAGNVVQNLAALGVVDSRVFGVVGDDVFGRELVFLLNKIKVDASGIVLQTQDWDTCAYTKPMQHGEEQNRLDFGTSNKIASDNFGKIMAKLEAQMPALDVLIINQQFSASLIDDASVTRLNALIEAYPRVCVIADMRAFGLSLRGATLKVNTAELARLLQLPGYEQWTESDCALYGRQLSGATNGSILITQGEHGMLYTDGQEVFQCPAVPLSGLIDPVGAGDTAVAAFAACMGAAIPIPVALEVANFAAAITVRKLNQTGTASPEEIIDIVKKSS